mmetsp:Transcript_16553/g.50821  ORF Transcript_16553/g.50821 Transcript_16553/m.50821 type:complete len:196 (-) Transcript_16553:1380-1967(-)
MRSLQAVCLGLLALALSPCKSFQGPRAMRTMGGARRAAMQPLRMDLGTTVQLAEEAAKGGFLSGVIDTMLENRIDGDIAGVLGGSIGVIGTLIFYEKRRVKMLERVLCPYCLGSGYLTCAVCHGAEALQVTPETRKALLGSAMVEGDECICPTCDGAGAVVSGSRSPSRSPSRSRSRCLNLILTLRYAPTARARG